MRKKVAPKPNAMSRFFRAPKLKAEKIIDKPIAAPESRMLSLLELNSTTCRWPIGDPQAKLFHFCGADVEKPGAHVYCAFHNRLAWQPRAARVQKRADQSFQHSGRKASRFNEAWS
jgi:hypothetical protein